jgi:serine/threonine protein kinase
MTMHDLYDVDESDGALIFGEGRYAIVRPAKRKGRRRSMSFSGARLQATKSQENIWSNGLRGGNKSSTDLQGAMVEYNCALKIIDKKEFWTRVKKGRERADTLVREAAVQTTLAVLGVETSGFLRLLNMFETGEHLVLELELLTGTDLFQHISSRGVLDEVEAAHIMRDLLNCLNVLDQIGIAHRDIKPANLLMCHDESNYGSKIKLADYGMASFVGVDNLVRGRCGTPGFVAPEVLLTHVNGGYGNKVDMFSAGVTLYVMLAGYEPFYGQSDGELIKANREAKVFFPHADWHTGEIAIDISPALQSHESIPTSLIAHWFDTINLVSVEGRDLIERMLMVDPSKRIGPSEALRHPWITRRAPLHSNEDVGNQASCSIVHAKQDFELC